MRQNALALRGACSAFEESSLPTQNPFGTYLIDVVDTEEKMGMKARNNQPGSAKQDEEEYTSEMKWTRLDRSCLRTKSIHSYDLV